MKNNIYLLSSASPPSSIENYTTTGFIIIVGLSVLATILVPTIRRITERHNKIENDKMEDDEEDNKRNQIYDRIEPFAKNIKIVLQMYIGLGLGLIITLKLLIFLQYEPATTSFPSITQLISKIPTLEIVGFALIYSTGIELAFTLFTDGPDEAITPLTTAVSAAILIGVSNPNNFSVQGAFAVAIGIIVLIALLLIDKIIIQPLLEEKRVTKKKKISKLSNADITEPLKNHDVKEIKTTISPSNDLSQSDIGKNEYQATKEKTTEQLFNTLSVWITKLTNIVNRRQSN